MGAKEERAMGAPEGSLANVSGAVTANIQLEGFLFCVVIPVYHPKT